MRLTSEDHALMVRCFFQGASSAGILLYKSVDLFTQPQEDSAITTTSTVKHLSMDRPKLMIEAEYVLKEGLHMKTPSSTSATLARYVCQSHEFD